MHRRSFDPARKCRRWSAPPGGGASPPAIALRIPCSVRSGGQLLQGSEAPAPGLMHRRSFDPAGSAVAGVLRPVAGRRPRPLRCAFHAPCGLGDSWLQGSGGSCTGRSFEPARKYRPWSRNPAAIPGRRVAQKGRPGHRRTLARPASPARFGRSRPSLERPVRPASRAVVALARAARPSRWFLPNGRLSAGTPHPWPALGPEGSAWTRPTRPLALPSNLDIITGTVWMNR